MIDESGKATIVRLPNIMAVEILELLDVEPRRRASDLGEIEPGGSVFAADDLFVAMAPAKAEQIVEQGLRQETELVAIGLDAERAMALGKLGAVGAMDQRHMAIDRLGPSHRPDDRELAKSIVEMVVAADDMRDPHVVIVDDDREHVGGRSVGAKQDEIIEFTVLDRHLSLDLVVDRGLAFLRRLQPDDECAVALVGAIAPGADDLQWAAFALGEFALRSDLLRSHPAFIGMAAGQHLLCHLGMAVGEMRLEIGLAVPVEAKPFHSVEDRVDRRLGGSGLVGILDAKQKPSAVPARVEPVEQGGPRAADMKKTGGRRREARNDGACAHANILLAATVKVGVTDAA